MTYLSSLTCDRVQYPCQRTVILVKGQLTYDQTVGIHKCLVLVIAVYSRLYIHNIGMHAIDNIVATYDIQFKMTAHQPD